MYKTFKDIVKTAGERGIRTVGVAVADDAEVLAALKAAGDQGLVRSILVGDEARIKPLAVETGLKDFEIIHQPDQDQAALAAARLVREGRAQVLMKGLINSSNFLKAVLDKENGLRKGRLLSHLAVFQTPGVAKLMFMSDGGLNVAPDLAAKKDILINALECLAVMGLTRPNVAVMSHNEQVNEKMPSTADAAALVGMAGRGELPPCVIEGPVAMDVAASAKAARHKKIDSRVSGAVDFFLMPNIESGNLVGKTLTYYAGSESAGLVLGATRPVVLVSRADPPEAKLYSIALACLAA